MASHKNHYLFSDHYLNEVLPELDDWKKDEGIQETFQKIKDLYQKVKGRIESAKESQNEEEFIKPILKILNHTYEVQPSVPMPEWAKVPDYAFFPDVDTKRKAARQRGRKEYFRDGLAIGDAKQWDRPLDKKIRGLEEPFSNQNPSYQIDSYLKATQLQWGILTTGRLWRLYNRETSFRLDSYYEVDLISLLEQELGDFKYFYLFFRKESFIKDPLGGSFLDRTFKGSIEYAEKVGDELKEKAYDALKNLIQGFLEFPQNNLGPDSDIKVVYDKSLILLYRLLFILYAESRKLLPVENTAYFENYSLASIKKEIADLTIDGVPAQTTKYWTILKGIFKLINEGIDSEGAPFKVPAYNGGLFDPAKHPELEKWSIGDKFLTKAIDLVSRIETERGFSFVDYRSLGVRHLGSIYEGLLEYRPKIASEDLIVKKEKGKEKYFPVRDFPGKEIAIKSGDVYLETDKGERKTTGSYYTPDYIVKYIVENTLGPLCNELEDKIRTKVKELKNKINKSRGRNRAAYEKQLEQVGKSFDDKVLRVKVLDPAMGSGHFLVRATEYLAERIVANAFTWDEEAPEGEPAISFWRRKVVERCIYGVDLNPLAVELAKLSLWLSTVAKGKPLSFLDHHLRCGNSLIGAKIEDLGTFIPVKKKRKRKEEPESQLKLFDESKLSQDMALTIGDEIQIETKPTDTIEQVKEKQKILDTLIERRRSKWKSLADLWTARYFSENLEKMDKGLLQHIADVVTSKATALPQVKPSIDEVKKIAENKHFFHWELEFPEVFFDKFGRKKENPGFNAVIGNPPWMSFSGRQKVEIDRAEFEWFRSFYTVFNGWPSLHTVFGEKAFSLIRKGGFHSFIVPDQVGYLDNYNSFRKKFCNVITSIRYTGEEVFKDVVSPTLVYIVSKRNIENVIVIDKTNKSSEIPLKTFSQLPSFTWTVRVSQSIWDKVIKLSLFMNKEFGDPGVHTGNCSKKLILNQKLQRAVPILEGSDIDRYNLPEVHSFLQLDYEPVGNEYFTIRNYSVYQKTKLLIRQTASNLIATRHTGLYFRNNLLAYYGNNQLSDLYILTLLNSNLLRKFYSDRYVESAQKVFPQVKVSHLRSLPIRKIMFNTSQRKRKELLDKFVRLYNVGLTTGGIHEYK